MAGPGLATPLLLLGSQPAQFAVAVCPGLATPLLLLGYESRRGYSDPCPGLATPLLLLGYQRVRGPAQYQSGFGHAASSARMFLSWFMIRVRPGLATPLLLLGLPGGA